MMRMSRTLTAATVVGIAAAVAAGPAVAAPTPAKSAPAKAAAAKKKKVNTKVIKAIRIQNRAYLAQRTKVAACAKLGSPTTQQVRTRAKSTLSNSAKMRKTALRGINARAATRSLTAKRTKLKKATTRLRTAARQCATVRPAVVTPAAPGVAAPAPAVPITVVVSPGPNAAVPSTPGVPGAPGVPGVPGLPGGTAIPAGTTPVQLSLSHLLGGTPLDLSAVLGPDGILPGTLDIVGLDQLLGGALGQNGLIGVDVQELLTLINTSVGTLTACGLLDVTCLVNNLTVTLNGTLTQVRALLDGAIAGDLTSLDGLLKVERLGDTVLRVVPVGPLAGLLSGVGGLDALVGGLQGGANPAGLLGGLLKL